MISIQKITKWHKLSGLLIVLFMIGSFISLSFMTLTQAHAATSSSSAATAVSGSNIANIAKGQIGGTCGDYYGCPYPGEWCAEFATWVWQHAGANVAGLTGAASSFYDYGKSHKTLSNTPKVGDAVVFGYNAGTNYAEHVAIVVSVNTSTHKIYSVGGNERGGAGVVAEDGPYTWTVGGAPTGQTISGYVAPVSGGTVTPVCPATIQNGSSGSLVQTLQGDLNTDYSKKVFPNSPYNFHPPLAKDGAFGPLTENAVKDFQTKKGLVVDGIVGPKTWHALGHC